MSTRVGQFQKNSYAGFVMASKTGVDVVSNDAFTMQPEEARSLAAILLRAADEVERVRKYSEQA